MALTGFMENVKTNITRYIHNEDYGKIDVLGWAFLGGLIFITIYGIIPLNVTNDHWLLNGYVELDATQHYAGWLAFRQSAWSIPLGKVDGLGGTVVTYTDSIPWIAILFKCFSNVLPTTFQYFGIYILGCLILQAISSGLLISLFSNNKLYTALGVILFCYSPIMLERAFRHSALASHWLILFMLYFYFKGRQNKQMDSRSIVIPILAIGIHPYFLPVVFGIMFANLVELVIIDRKTVFRSGLYLVGSFITTVVAGYLLGALGTSSSLGGDGYGYFSMNLNAVVNPTSCGNIVWSRFLNVLPQTLGNYDGFNYLGLGILCGIVVLLLLAFLNKGDIVQLLKNNYVLLLLSIGFWLFAVSNVVTLNGNILFEYPLPSKILSFASIFRASSRIFYPVFYLIMLSVIIGIFEFPKKKVNFAILLGIVVIQLVDISPALQTKYESFKLSNIEKTYNEGPFTGSSLWNDIADKQLKIKMLNNSFDYRLAAFGEKNKLNPDITISSSHYSGGIDLNEIYLKNIAEVENGDLDENGVYVTSDENLLTTILLANSNINLYKDADYYVLTSDNYQLNGNCLNIEDYKQLRAYDLTDDNWRNGISKFDGSKTILFEKNDNLLRLLENAENIYCQNQKFEIINVSDDEMWIHVGVDRDADVCQYPNSLVIK